MLRSLLESLALSKRVTSYLAIQVAGRCLNTCGGSSGLLPGINDYQSTLGMETKSCLNRLCGAMQEVTDQLRAVIVVVGSST